MTTFGGESVGSAYVEVHAIPSPALSAEAAAIAEKTALAIQAKMAPAFEKSSKSINTAALGIVAGIALIGKKAVTSFSDTTEALNVTDVAFKQNAAGVKKWASGLSSSFGLTNKQLLATSSNFALLLENASASIEVSTELSKALTQRAGDLSSFFNISGSETIDKLTSGLVGEARAVRSLGIDVSETAVSMRAQQLGIKAVNGELSQGAKVQIRAQLILEQSTKAQGDAIRTAGTFEGRLRTLRGEVGDLSLKIGRDLIPSLGLIGIGAEQTVKTLNEMPDPLRAIFVNLTAAASAAVAAAFAWSKLAPAILSVRNALSVSASAVKLGGSLLLDLGAVALLGPVGAVAGLIALGKATTPAIAGIKELNGLVGNADGLLDAFFNKAAKEHGPGFFDTAREFVFGAKDTMTQTADELRKSLDDVFAASPDTARRIVEAAERDTGAFGKAYSKGLREELTKLSPQLPKIDIPIDVHFDFAKTAADALKESLSGLDTIASANKSVADAQQRAQDAAKGTAALQAQTLEFPRKLAAANAELTRANQDVTDATDHLNTVEAERARVLADTASEARELADAEQAVYRARRTLQDLDESREATLRELQELQREGPQNLAEADRAILRAKIALNTATREEKELLEGLNDEHVATLDLSGLSLDQIKTRLAGARAALAVARSTKNATKTAQQLEDEGLTSKLNVVDAEQAYQDAIQARTDLEYDQGIRQRELDETLADITQDREDGLRRQTEVQNTLNGLRDGETTRATTIRDLDLEIKTAKESQRTAIEGVHTAEDGVRGVEQDRKTLNDDIRDAKLKQRDAELEVKAAIEQRKMDVATILKDEQAINAALLERVKALPAKTEMEQNIQRQLLAGSIPTLLRGANMVNPVTGAPIAGPVQVTQALIDDIVSRLLRSSGSDILAALRAILKSAGLNIQGLAVGGLVERAPTSFGVLRRLGESGAEAILPITDSQAMKRLLANPRVLNPVLANLPRISLPNQGGPVAALKLSNGVTGAGGALSRQAARQDKRELAQLIAEALVAAGGTSGDVTVNNEFAIAGIDEQQLMRKVNKQIERSLRNHLR